MKLIVDEMPKEWSECPDHRMTTNPSLPVSNNVMPGCTRASRYFVCRIGEEGFECPYYKELGKDRDTPHTRVKLTDEEYKFVYGDITACHDDCDKPTFGNITLLDYMKVLNTITPNATVHIYHNIGLAYARFDATLTVNEWIDTLADGNFGKRTHYKVVPIAECDRLSIHMLPGDEE